VNRRNLLLNLAYDGSAYQGWQDNVDQPSIEGALRPVCAQILQHEVTLQAASRTDAGVHALGQAVNLWTERSLPCAALQRGLNALLPVDIRVLDLREMPPSFHPTLHCLRKSYLYKISRGRIQLPQERFFAWHVYDALDVAAMRQCARLFIGTMSFKAFCNQKKNESYASYERTVESIEISEPFPHAVEIRIKGPRFLYKMVRNLVGTMIDVGRGKRQLEEVRRALASERRPEAGVTAPAHGLCLERIDYAEFSTGIEKESLLGKQAE
jgi:tRNA pseudouridine38-40 synthase